MSKSTLTFLKYMILVTISVYSTSAYGAPQFETKIKGVLSRSPEAHTFTGIPYDTSFQLPLDADQAFDLYDGHVIHVIAGGFDLEHNTMWILRFYDPMLKQKVQLYPGLPGDALKKEVIDISDAIEKYGFLYVSKLELDPTKIYLFNFGKTVAIDVKIDEEIPLNLDQVAKEALQTSTRKQISDQENAFETQSQLLNLGDLLASLNNATPDIQILAQVEAIELIRSQFTAQRGHPIDPSQITIVETTEINVKGAQVSPTQRTIIVTVQIESETLMAKADYDTLSGKVEDVQTLDQTDDLAGAIKARDTLATALDIEDKNTITVAEIIPTVNHIMEKQKQQNPDKPSLVTNEYVLEIGNQTYVMQTNFVAAPASALMAQSESSSMTARDLKNPGSSSSIEITKTPISSHDEFVSPPAMRSTNQGNAAESSASLNSPMKETKTITIHHGVWGPVKIQVPNTEDKRVALLEQIKDFTPTKENKPESMNPSDQISRILEPLGLDENFQALKHKEETKQSQQKEKEKIENKGITLKSAKESESDSLGRSPQGPQGGN